MRDPCFAHKQVPIGMKSWNQISDFSFRFYVLDHFLHAEVGGIEEQTHVRHIALPLWLHFK
jgi:hypothetical protein